LLPDHAEIVAMPFIIWGSRGLTSTVENGDFHCPRCDQQQEYALKQVRPWFTLYFIPIFPVGGAEKYVECLGCGNTYKDEVLNYEPPSEADRFLRQAYDEVVTGTSLEVMKKKLTNFGMDDHKADEVLDEMCGGERRYCACGQTFHPKVKKCTNCGEKL
jgi:hypothetical protein